MQVDHKPSDICFRIQRLDKVNEITEKPRTGGHGLAVEVGVEFIGILYTVLCASVFGQSFP